MHQEQRSTYYMLRDSDGRQVFAGRSVELATAIEKCFARHGIDLQLSIGAGEIPRLTPTTSGKPRRKKVRAC